LNDPPNSPIRIPGAEEGTRKSSRDKENLPLKDASVRFRGRDI
jgi:hypothetical protein